MRAIIITFLFMVFCWGVFYFSFHRDRSRYRNCYLLFLAMISGFPFLVNAAGPYYIQVSLIVVYLVLAGLLITPFFLIFNGFVIMKKEGRRIPHLLSLGLGIVIFLGELAVIANIIFLSITETPEEYFEVQSSWLHLLSMLFAITIIYGSMSVLVFTIYTLLLQKIPWKKSFDYVIILGAGLIGGEKVSKLLAGRIDKAIEVYRRSDKKAKLIPSGGQGADEKIPEAEAMKRYLLERGIPEDDIILEDKSTTTYENLTNSKKIIEGFSSEKSVALVSSNYHVFRAIRYCRKIGFKCVGIGGHTAFYYWPSALLREYIAIHTEKKHALTFILGWVLCMVLAVIKLK